MSAQPTPSTPSTFGRRASRVFVTVFLALALAVAGYSVWIASRVEQDPELREQLQEVHQRAARGEAPTDTTGR